MLVFHFMLAHLVLKCLNGRTQDGPINMFLMFDGCIFLSCCDKMLSAQYKQPSNVSQHIVQDFTVCTSHICSTAVDKIVPYSDITQSLSRVHLEPEMCKSSIRLGTKKFWSYAYILISGTNERMRNSGGLLTVCG